jgi:hypothetical protein
MAMGLFILRGRRNESIEKQALVWNVQGIRRRDVLKQTWKMTVLEDAGKCGKTWSEVEEVGGQQSQMEMFYQCPIF